MSYVVRFAGGRVHNAVHKEPFMGVGEFLGLLVRDLGEDDRGQGRGGGGRCSWRRVFGEDCCAVGYTGAIRRLVNILLSKQTDTVVFGTDPVWNRHVLEQEARRLR